MCPTGCALTIFPAKVGAPKARPGSLPPRAPAPSAPGPPLPGKAAVAKMLRPAALPPYSQPCSLVAPAPAPSRAPGPPLLLDMLRRLDREKVTIESPCIGQACSSWGAVQHSGGALFISHARAQEKY